MTPKHVVDDELEEYLKVTSSIPPAPLEEVEKKLSKVVHSADEARKEVQKRLSTDTGIHYLDHLDEIHKAIAQVEHEKRLEAENKVKSIGQWFAATLSLIVAGLVTAGVIWLISQADKVKP